MKSEDTRSEKPHSSLLFSSLLAVIAVLAVSSAAVADPTCLNATCNTTDDTTCVIWQGDTISPECVQIDVGINNGPTCATLVFCPPSPCVSCTSTVSSCSACFMVSAIAGCGPIGPGNTIDYTVTECSSGEDCTISATCQS